MEGGDTAPTDTASGGSDADALHVHIRRGYLALPIVDGSMITDPRVTALEDALPLHLRIVRV